MSISTSKFRQLFVNLWLVNLSHVGVVLHRVVTNTITTVPQRPRQTTEQSSNLGNC